MEIIKHTSPYIRKNTSTQQMMADVLISLIPVVAFAIYRFGTDVIIRLVVSLAIMIGIEALAFFLSKKEGRKYTLNQVLPPAISAVIFTMLIPSQLPIYVVVVGSLFGIVIGKLLFGGLGANVFNPAASGRIFIALALGGTFVYSDLVGGSTVLGQLDTIGLSATAENYSVIDLLIGNIPGSMGEISAIAILIGLAYLLIRRAADFRVVVSMILTFAVLMFIAGLAIDPSSSFEYMSYHVLSGGLLFGAVYMVTDPVTSPVTRPGRYIYGSFIGLMVVLIRLFGGYPEGVAFAILIGNSIVPLLDHHKWATNVFNKKTNIILGIFSIILIIFAVVIFAAKGGF